MPAQTAFLLHGRLVDLYTILPPPVNSREALALQHTGERHEKRPRPQSRAGPGFDSKKASIISHRALGALGEELQIASKTLRSRASDGLHRANGDPSRIEIRPLISDRDRLSKFF